jgi:UDP-N-acetylglucosamine pyrophosphorylase
MASLFSTPETSATTSTLLHACTPFPLPLFPITLRTKRFPLQMRRETPRPPLQTTASNSKGKTRFCDHLTLFKHRLAQFSFNYQSPFSFIFDAFETVPPASFFCMEVSRAEEFAPVKNANGVDSPASARAMVDALHRSWVVAAGGVVDGDGVVEVRSSLSYEGEGLQGACGGKTFTTPVLIE